MIDGSRLYLAISDTLLELNRKGLDSCLGDFAHAMSLAPSGVSLDQAIQHSFRQHVPGSISSLSLALLYAATFLQMELIDFWGCSNCQEVVDSLRAASMTADIADWQPVAKDLAKRLQSS